ANPRRQRRVALNGAARWVAAAAVVLALLAASRAPAPRRIVTDLAGFVADLVPGVAGDRGSDADPQPGNRRGQPVENPAPAASDGGADDNDVPPAAADNGLGERSGEEHPVDNSSGTGRFGVPRQNEPPVRRPAGPPPATTATPSTSTGHRPSTGTSSNGTPRVGGPPAARATPTNPDAPRQRGEERPAEITTTTEVSKAKRTP
ncbi:MAG: hypothetical protein LC799_20980, partial [Actinobacteria bacterium]|nr:hypothetical protein [Actinomycetota bacterium]